MEADYLAQCLPEPVVILGQRLEPLSLGHVKLLRRIGNAYTECLHPFLRPVGNPTLQDLAFAIFICAQPYAEALCSIENGVKRPGWRGFIKSHWTVLEFITHWLLRVKALDPSFDFPANSAAFMDYLKANSTFPDMHDPSDDDSRAPGAPFIQRVQIILQGRMGASRAEALNTPWGEAVHDYFAYWELEGCAKIMSAEDHAHLAEVKKLMGEIRAEILADQAKG